MTFSAEEALWIRSVTKTTTYPMTVDDFAVLADAVGGAFTVTLPSAAHAVKRAYAVKRINSGANAVTVASASGTIDGAATVALSAQYQSLLVVPDGTDWFVIGRDAVIPPGLIAMWSGTLASIPSGWLLCDGTSGTPDLRDKFVRGAAAGAGGGATGGVDGHTHGGHTTHAPAATGVESAVVAAIAGIPLGNVAAINHTHQTPSLAHSNHSTSANIPAYFACVFIMKV